MRKTRLLFLIHDKFVNNFESIYNSVKNSNEFEMTVVACDSLPTDYKGKTSSKEISDYIKSRNIDCIDAFDYQTNSWIDLAQFKADYIFVSTPYDIYRPKEYSSYRLSMIAKLCSVAYAATTNIDNDFLLSNPFFYNCSYFFICDENEKTFSEQMKTSPLNKKFVPIGCVKLDKYLFGEYKAGNWEKLFPHTENNLRITWKPRWCQENTEIFFDFLEGLINYSKKHDVDVLLLEHPLFRDTLKSKGLLKKYEDILNSKSGNLICYDGDDFLDYVLESDVLVGETTSLMAEYLIANKPIILVGDYSCLNEFGKTLIEPDNAVITFHELKKRLKKLCHNSEISFENKRLFKPADNRSSADYLLEFLKTDFDSITDYFIELNKRLTNELDGIEKILTQGYYSDGFLDKNCYNSETVANLLKVWSDSLVRLQTELQSKENQQ